jgi:hypothetical protein
VNSPRLQPGGIGTPSDLGFSPDFKIKAVAKAESRSTILIHELKHVAIHVLRAKCPIVWIFQVVQYARINRNQ